METKKERLKILQDRISQQTAKLSNQMIGTNQIILVTNETMGRTENNRTVHFQAQSENLIGKLISVRITEAKPFSLTGIVE